MPAAPSDPAAALPAAPPPPLLVAPRELSADAALIDRLGAAFCLTQGLLPLPSQGAITPVAAADPEAAETLRPHIESVLGPVVLAHAPRRRIEAALARLRRHDLAEGAARRPPRDQSCRSLPAHVLRRAALALLILLAAALVTTPLATLAALTALSLAVLVANTVLIAAAGLAAARAGRDRAPPAPAPLCRDDLPPISLIVALYREPELALALLARLRALDYPRTRLELILVLEEDDHATQAALARAPLPPGGRILRVPGGGPLTKPRALNYALPFCRGSVIGIYDAEDAPDPDQLLKVAARFAAAPPDLACLQGVLDFYNAEDTWLTRCFALDYAMWFRLILPGLAELGLVLPLGGTTVFIRRAALEAVGAWDAHNVTEDADLGVRLARHGYRTAILASTTREEAVATALPWIRQRSRWLKGYAMTWIVHARRPLALCRDLGPLRWLGVHLLFGAAVTGYLLAPVLWLCWLGLVGLRLPWLGPLTGLTAAGVTAVLLLCTAVQLTVALRAAALRGTPWLAGWAPALWVYFALGSLAALKALAEILFAPTYWDKTAHGRAARRRAAEPSGGPGYSAASVPASARSRVS
ncbi:MAG: glycosyltransferase [Tranquillimonas sp.]